MTDWTPQTSYRRGEIVTMRTPWRQWSFWERVVYRLTHRLRSTPDRVDTMRVMASGTMKFMHEGEPTGGEYLLPIDLDE